MSGDFVTWRDLFLMLAGYMLPVIGFFLRIERRLSKIEGRMKANDDCEK